MTFRAAVAAGLLAAVGLGCSEAPKSRTTNTTPQQARVLAPKKKLGSYTMTVTPLPQSNGRRASVVVVPDAQDGSAATNPAGTVQVAGRFDATITAAGATGCVGSQSLGLPLTVTNFAVEPLLNVQVQVTSMSKTGFEVCKVGGGTVGTGLGDPTLLPPPANTAPGASLGLADYGTLTGAVNGAIPVNTGAFPGGGRSLTWWFKYPSNTPVTFKFSVWADPQQPVLNSVAELATGAALTWSSAGSTSSQLELCATDPAANASRPFACPAPIVTQATALGAGAFSAIPAGLTPGATYWWRAANTFSGGGVLNVAANFASGWDTFVATAPLAAAPPTLVAPLAATFPADALATGLTPVLLQWNTDVAVTDALYQICTGPCPAPLTPADPLAANLVWEDIVPWIAPAVVGGPGYEVDVTGFLPTDPLTGNAWLATGSYNWQVYNYDAATAVVFGTPTASTFGIAAAAAVGPDVTAPVAGELFPANLLALNTSILATWTSDPAVSETVFQLCDTATCVAAAPFLGIQAGPTAVVGFAPTPGAAYEYTVDLLHLIPTDLVNAGGAWLLPGTYWLHVSNSVAGVPTGVATVVSFQVVSSMPNAPVITGPAGALPANTFSNLLPINLTWTTDPAIVETAVHVCGTVACTGDPLLDFLALPVLPLTPGSYAYDAGVTPDFPLDPLVSTITNGYLAPGTYNWGAYNIDPVSLAQLLPGSTSTVVITAVPYGAGAFAVSTPNLSVATPVVISWTGPKAVSKITYEIYDATLAIVDTFVLSDDNSLGAASSHFSTANLAAVLPAGAYSWNVIDDGLALTFPFTLGAVPATDAIWTKGTFTTVP